LPPREFPACKPMGEKQVHIHRPAVWLCFAALAGMVVLGCSRAAAPSQGASPATTGQSAQSTMAAPPCIIYKTRSDYSRNVAVSLSEDRNRIVSYPDVSDILKQGNSVYPVPLKEGFLLDNRGIGPEVAFLSMTYEAFMQLDETPSSSELFQRLLDADPLTEMYQCGTRYQYTDPVNELNQLITTGNFTGCKKLK